MSALTFGQVAACPECKGAGLVRRPPLPEAEAKQRELERARQLSRHARSCPLRSTPRQACSDPIHDRPALLVTCQRCKGEGILAAAEADRGAGAVP